MPRFTPDPSLSIRIAHNMRRMISAVEVSERVISDAKRHGERRLARLPRRTPDTEVWRTPDGTIVCRLVARTPFIHEVELSVNGQITARVFDDPVEAADEASRLRQVFLDD